MDPLLYIGALALVPLAVLGLVVLLKRPEWTPAILLLAATATPWSFAKGVTPVLVLTAVLSLTRLLYTMVTGTHDALEPAPPRRAALLFALAAACSAAWSWMAMETEVRAFWTPMFLPVQLGQLSALVLAPAALLVTSALVTRRSLLQVVVVSYLVLTSIGLVVSLVLPFELVNLRGLVLTWSAALVWGQLLFNEELGVRARGVLMAVLAVTLYVKFVLAFTWVSGWLPTLVALAVITWFRSWRAMLALIVAGLVVVLLAGTFLEQDYDREYDESGSTRMAKWTLVASQPFVRNHFLLGTGPANYALYFSAYTPQDRLSTHNNYADIYLQMGLVGIGVLFWVVVGTGRLALAIRKAGPSDPFVDAFVHSVIGGVAAVLVAMMLGDWFTPFVYNQTLAGFSWTVQSWIFMGALCAVPTILRDESDAAAGFPALAGHLS